MGRKAWQYSKLDRGVTIRFRKLGELGEAIASGLLENCGFESVENLNSSFGFNCQYFDLRAQRNRQSYVISVKARNKFENSVAGRRLNGRYKLFEDPDAASTFARNRYESEAAWVTIAFDFPAGTVDSYFGTLASLQGNQKGVPMSSKAIQAYECLAAGYRLANLGIQPAEYEHLFNAYERRIRPLPMS